jgi:glycosyltransferase involved in cell wall biosynthesis
MELSVVIPVRNEERHLGPQLEALLAQQWDGEWEIIVVDNGSTDGTVELVKRYAQDHDRLRVLVAAEKPDQSYAANRGVAAASADSVAFCDADDIVSEGWVAAMARGLADHEVVTGPNELDRLNPDWLAASRGRSIEEPLGSFFGIFPLVRGNNYGVRHDVWDRIGPLDDAFAQHGVLADVEFSLRCWRAGIEIVGLPEAVVHYRYRTGARDLLRQGWNYGSHRPKIARMLIDAGEPRPPRFSGWRSWVVLVATLPGVLTTNGRARWLWVAGNRLGQVAGSIRYRTLML